MKSTHFTQMDSPIGVISLCGTEHGLAGIFMEDHCHGPSEAHRHGWQRADRLFAEVRAQLEEYFIGRRTVFSVRIDRDAVGGTSFQRQVWKALEGIPYGVTISYGELARRINHPTAVRAVGLANGRNPLSIIVPCHRVIGSDGKLTGYGGGMDRKRWLLDLETYAMPAERIGGSAYRRVGVGGVGGVEGESKQTDSASSLWPEVVRRA
jgi:O-6-methylguanine DNA methyltransferase